MIEVLAGHIEQCPRRLALAIRLEPETYAPVMRAQWINPADKRAGR